MNNKITCIYNPNKKHYDVDCANKISIDEINTIPNGSIDHIFCEVLDSLDIENREKLQSEIMKKIMIGGTVYFRYLNSTILVKKIIRQEIDLNRLNEIFYVTSSIVDNNYIISWLEHQTNFSVLKNDIDDIFSHIKLQRNK